MINARSDLGKSMRRHFYEHLFYRLGFSDCLEVIYTMKRKCHYWAFRSSVKVLKEVANGISSKLEKELSREEYTMKLESAASKGYKMNTEKLESALELIVEFMEENTLYDDQVWHLKRINKDLSEFAELVRPQ